MISFLIRPFDSYVKTVSSDIWLSDSMILLNAKIGNDKSANRLLKQSQTIQEFAYASRTDNELETLFDIAMVRAKKLFSEHAFRKSHDGKRRAPINKCLFETWGVLLCELNDDEYQRLYTNRNKLIDEYSDKLSGSTAGVIIRTNVSDILDDSDNARYGNAADAYLPCVSLEYQFRTHL